ncbi:MAG: leucyl aminopeptidase family protein [Myxococcota bacterium]
MPSRVAFVTDVLSFDSSPVRVFVGRKSRLLDADVLARVPADVAGMWAELVHGINPGDDGAGTTTWTSGGKVIIGVLPERCSRHNTQTRAWSMARLCAVGGKKDVGICVAVNDAEHAWAAAVAVGRANPAYTASSTPHERTVRALILAPSPVPSTDAMWSVSEGVRRAASWVDQPPNVLNTVELTQAAMKCAAEVGAEVSVIRGSDLKDQGFGGIWGVGKGSSNPPAFVVLRWRPDGATGPSLGWVGKGITYDTGGLSIKSKTGMVGMKTDMGGAAAVLGAFWSAAKLGLKRNITAVLCIAENSVGPDSTRPDDVLQMLSGRTVEVNNTDAEGRLVLADGLAWMIKNENPDVIADCATLTGAQLVATGKRHAAVYCNTDEIEAQMVSIGKRTGDLVHSLPFAPEFYRKEFKSQVADLRNSVKDRANAQCSCAGQFLHEHMRGFEGQWAHIDLAGPAVSGGRGTGFGVALLLGLAGLMSDTTLKA